MAKLNREAIDQVRSIRRNLQKKGEKYPHSLVHAIGKRSDEMEGRAKHKALADKIRRKDNSYDNTTNKVK